GGGGGAAQGAQPLDPLTRVRQGVGEPEVEGVGRAGCRREVLRKETETGRPEKGGEVAAMDGDAARHAGEAAVSGLDPAGEIAGLKAAVGDEFGGRRPGEAQAGRQGEAG